MAADNSTSDSQSVADSQPGDGVQLPAERVAGIGDSRPPSFQYVYLSTVVYFLLFETLIELKLDKAN